MEQDNQLYIAHTRQSDGTQQSLQTHLDEVAEICKALAVKIGMEEAGELIGLLHDFGKYSRDFQNYIRSATGLFDPDHGRRLCRCQSPKRQDRPFHGRRPMDLAGIEKIRSEWPRENMRADFGLVRGVASQRLDR